MADIFNEVDEELRRERAMRFWSRYQFWIIGLAVLIVIGAGGWRFWEYQQRTAAEAAGNRFQAAIKLASEGKNKEAQAAFEEIAKSGPSGYAMLAKFRAANQVGKADREAAIKLYDEVAANASAAPLLRDAARLRAGILLVDSGKLDEVKKRLDPLATQASAYRATAREMLALTAINAGDYKAASVWLDMIISDAQAPQSTRQRAIQLQSLVASGKPPGSE